MTLARTFGLVGATALGTTIVLGVARLASADGQMAKGSDIEPIHVVVHGPPAECASGDDFLEAVKSRTARVRVANPGEAARTFRVEIQRKKSGEPRPIFGQLIVQEADGGASDSRSIRGATCAEVESALELITALAIDPDAQMSLHPRERDAAAADGDADADAGDASATATASDAAATTDVPTNADGQLTLATPLEVPSRPWIWSAGLGLDFVGSGQSPISVGGRAFGETRAPGGDVLTPSFRLALAYFSSTTGSIDNAVATFRWFTAQADLCPLRLAVAEQVHFIPCASLEAGIVHATSAGTSGFDLTNRPWFSAGPVGRFSLEAVDPLLFELWGGLRVPFERDTFTFGGADLVYRAPPVLGSAGIDVAVRFP